MIVRGEKMKAKGEKRSLSGVSLKARKMGNEKKKWEVRKYSMGEVFLAYSFLLFPFDILCLHHV